MVFLKTAKTLNFSMWTFPAEPTPDPHGQLLKKTFTPDKYFWVLNARTQSESDIFGVADLPFCATL